MVPPHSHRVSRVQWYSGYSLLFFPFAYETITLCGGPSHALLLGSNIHFAVLPPAIFLQPVWPLPRSLATTCGISVDFSSSPYLDVSVQAVPFVHLFDSMHDTGVLLQWVSPFGHPRIDACFRLPVAFRRLLRPSSAPGAKAFPLRSL